MTWFHDIWLARMIADERVAPRRRKDYRPTPRAGTETLRPLLEAAQAEANIVAAGPTMIRYFATEHAGQWHMDVGVPISRDWVQAAGEAQIVTAPALECGAILHWGSLAHIGDSYAALNRGITEAGLTNVGEGREWYLHFAGDTSTDNVILLQLEVKL